MNSAKADFMKIIWPVDCIQKIISSSVPSFTDNGNIKYDIMYTYESATAKFEF